MINADYELLSVTTDEGEKYHFQDKEKMYKFLKSAVVEFHKTAIRTNGFGSYWKPFIYRGKAK